MHGTTYIRIGVDSNNPCHLTCYWTDKKPGKHHHTRVVRGLLVPWGVYFCFVGWNAVEQLEAGDTLSHTFVLSIWEYCQIRWFTFRGTINGEISPSVGPIFQHHHIGTTLYEHYSTGNDDGWEFYSQYIRGETFTPELSHTITHIKLMLNRQGLPGTLYAHITPTLAGVPTVPDVSLGYIDGNTLTLLPTGKWYDIPLDPPYPLTAGTMYAIVCLAPSGNRHNFPEWQVDRTAPTYPRGTRCWSNDLGVTWNISPLYDYLFEEWGHA